MSSDSLAELQDHNYINLETYRKSGLAVRTPVWFVIFDDQIFIVTTKDTGKVKRIKNNTDVKIMPCGIRGEPKGEWIPAKARFASEEEAEKAVLFRNKKYGFRAKMVSLFLRNGEPKVIAVKP